MRKVLVVAIREYTAAVKTKAFVIGLMVMPILMAASIVVQVLLQGKDSRYAVIDRTGKQVFADFQKWFDLLNTARRVDPETGEVSGPEVTVEEVTPSADTPEAIAQQRLELSERIRKGEIAGVLEIGADALTNPPPRAVPGQPQPEVEESRLVRLQTNKSRASGFTVIASASLTRVAQERRLKELPRVVQDHLSPQKVDELVRPVEIEGVGLSRRDPDSGKVEEDVGIGRAAPFVVPFALIMLMFMVVMMGATPLMQGVVEEKMNRIAEVLLGSVPPFQLMLGKLLGMTAVSLTISAVYLGGGFWMAHRFGLARFVPVDLLLWFVLFQALASLMFGSLFIAIGAACSDMKETQNLLWPVMMLVCVPLFLMPVVLEQPNGPLATGLSMFPFATPMLMVARQGIPPGVPALQLLAGVALVLAMTTLCVWAAGRIFRVGLLMQGKGANLREIARWVVRG